MADVSSPTNSSRHIASKSVAEPDRCRIAIGFGETNRTLQIAQFLRNENEQPDLEDLINNVEVEALYLSSQSVPRGRLPFLAKPELKWLAVIRSQFSDPAIDDLPDSLTHFNATRTRISDAGLKKFHRLKNLKVLKLNRTQTSRAAIEQLIKEMPECKISWEPLQQAPNRFESIN